MDSAQNERGEVGETRKNHDIYIVPGLRRGLLLLEAVADSRRPVSVSEIATRLELSRSTVFRLIYTLRHMGFLEEVGETKSLTLGPRVLNIGYAYLASKDIIAVSRADLELLRDETHVSAHLAIRDRKEVLYLSCVQSRSGFLSSLNVGTRLPAYSTPMGWLLLSDLSNRELSSLFSGATFEALTDQTPKNISELMQKTSEAVVQGYMISRGAVEAGGSSIAAPIYNRDGNVVAAIDISGPDSAFNPANFGELNVQQVVNAASRISARLGYVPARAR